MSKDNFWRFLYCTIGSSEYKNCIREILLAWKLLFFQINSFLSKKNHEHKIDQEIANSIKYVYISNIEFLNSTTVAFYKVCIFLLILFSIYFQHNFITYAQDTVANRWYIMWTLLFVGWRDWRVERVSYYDYIISYICIFQ